jgi:putative transposase
MAIDNVIFSPRQLPNGPGRPREVTIGEILDAILFVVRTGCQWRMLPHDFPKWKTVYHYFRLWRIQGLWEQLHDHLRNGIRENAGRETSPSAGINDSQSVKTTENRRSAWLRCREENQRSKTPCHC